MVHCDPVRGTDVRGPLQQDTPQRRPLLPDVLQDSFRAAVLLVIEGNTLAHRRRSDGLQTRRQIPPGQGTARRQDTLDLREEVVGCFHHDVCWTSLQQSSSHQKGTLAQVIRAGVILEPRLQIFLSVALSRWLTGWDDLLVDRGGGGSSVESASPSYRGLRYPVEVISHWVWLYHRF